VNVSFAPTCILARVKDGKKYRADDEQGSRSGAETRNTRQVAHEPFRRHRVKCTAVAAGWTPSRRSERSIARPTAATLASVRASPAQPRAIGRSAPTEYRAVESGRVEPWRAHHTRRPARRRRRGIGRERRTDGRKPTRRPRPSEHLSARRRRPAAC